jgi:hypothetical protein
MTYLTKIERSVGETSEERTKEKSSFFSILVGGEKATQKAGIAVAIPISTGRYQCCVQYGRDSRDLWRCVVVPYPRKTLHLKGRR